MEKLKPKFGHRSCESLKCTAIVIEGNIHSFAALMIHKQTTKGKMPCTDTITKMMDDKSYSPRTMVVHDRAF